MSDPYEELNEKERSSYFNTGVIAGILLTLFIEWAICMVLHFGFGVI